LPSFSAPPLLSVPPPSLSLHAQKLVLLSAFVIALKLSLSPSSLIIVVNMDHFTPDAHYATSSQQHQSQGQQQQQPWHLMSATTAAAVPQQPSFSSPVVSPSTGPGESSAYPAFYHPSPRVDTAAAAVAAAATRMPLDRTTTAASSTLSLNMSGLTVTSPTAVSPIHPPSLHSAHSNSTASSTLSPVTPISPTSSSSFSGLHAAAVAASSSSQAQQQQQQHHHHHHHPYQYTATPSYDDHHHQQHHAHQLHPYRVDPTPLGAPEKQIPRKRSFTGSAGSGGAHQSVPEETEPASSSSYHDDMNNYPSVSPVDGSNSGGEVDDFLPPPSQQQQAQHHQQQQQQQQSTPQNMGMGMHKPVGTHNFVTKLYM
jgi:hypothetical protein